MLNSKELNKIKPIGLYLHIPFCLKKCPYCAFYSVKFSETLIEQFVCSLIAEICSMKEKLNEEIAVDSIFFGGGTPTLLSGKQLEKILDCCFKNFKILNSAEISIEANPGTIDSVKAKLLKEMGFNRISLGVQSTSNEDLVFLKRLHDFERSKKAIECFKLAGFENISVDFMIGLPNQTEKVLNENVKFLKDFEIKHCSAYMLSIEEGTQFEKINLKNLPSEELVAKEFEQFVALLEKNGFKQYEISNFSKPTFECKHNFKYWEQGEFIGFGPGAHSFFNNQRFFYEPSVEKFLSKERRVKIVERMDSNLEWIALKMRTTKGLSKAELKQHGFWNANFEKKLQELIKLKFLSVENSVFKLTVKGMLILNSIYQFLLF